MHVPLTVPCALLLCEADASCGGAGAYQHAKLRRLQEAEKEVHLAEGVGRKPPAALPSRMEW